MALAQHYNANHTFNPAHVAFNRNNNQLAQEAFPGELAALRAELSQLKQPKTDVAAVKVPNAINNATSMMESISINQDFFPSVMVAQKVEDLSYAFGATIATKA